MPENWTCRTTIGTCLSLLMWAKKMLVVSEERVPTRTMEQLRKLRNTSVNHQKEGSGKEYWFEGGQKNGLAKGVGRTDCQRGRNMTNKPVISKNDTMNTQEPNVLKCNQNILISFDLEKLKEKNQCVSYCSVFFS